MAYINTKKNEFVLKTLLVAGLWAGAPLVASADSGGSDNGSSVYNSNNDGSAMDAVMVSLEQENYQQAIAELKLFVKEQGETADALNLLGFSNRKLKNYDDAYDYYIRALSMEPDHLGANEYLGELYVETEQPDKAQTQLDRLYDICQSECREYTKLKEVIDASM